MEAIEEKVDFFFAFDGRVDAATRTLTGVAVISKGPAIGMGAVVDDETLNQIVALGNASPAGIRCRRNHPDERGRVANYLERLIGYATNFRRDVDVVRADCKLLSPAAAPAADQILALAQEAPKQFGVSIVAVDKIVNGALRMKTLYALDFVDVPAANPGGLFEAGAEQGAPHMAEEKKAADPEKLEAEVKDGKLFCTYAGKHFEVSIPGSHKLMEAEAEAEGEQTKEVSQASAEVNAEKVAKDAVAAERQYRKEFLTCLSAAQIVGDEAKEFEEQFYGRPMGDVKFFATIAVKNRAKPVGEGGNVTEKPVTKNTEDGEVAQLEARFDEYPTIREHYLKGNENAKQDSDAYKAAKARYVASHKKGK